MKQEFTRADGSWVTHNVLEGEYRLRFDGLDEWGFGHATDPVTNREYLLNQDTRGWQPDRLAPGQIFTARIITMSCCIMEIENTAPLPNTDEIELVIFIPYAGINFGYAVDPTTIDPSTELGTKYALHSQVVMPAGKRWQDFVVGQRFMAMTNGHGCVSEITLVLP